MRVETSLSTLPLGKNMEISIQEWKTKLDAMFKGGTKPSVADEEVTAAVMAP